MQIHIIIIIVNKLSRCTTLNKRNSSVWGDTAHYQGAQMQVKMGAVENWVCRTCISMCCDNYDLIPSHQSLIL